MARRQRLETNISLSGSLPRPTRKVFVRANTHVLGMPPTNAFGGDKRADLAAVDPYFSTHVVNRLIPAQLEGRKPLFLAKYGRWEVFIRGILDSKSCFILSTPLKSQSPVRDRAKPYFFLTRHSDKKHFDEISVILEHVPKKLTDFFDQNMLQVVVLERILIDRVLPPDRNTL